MPDDDAPPRHSALARGGLYAGPLVALLTHYLTGPDFSLALSDPARLVAAVAAWMACWWVSEAVPLGATALLPLVLFPLLGVSSIGAAAAPFADPLIFLFLGGFLLGVAFEKSGLHQRVALLAVWLVGSRPAALVAGVMAATALISMWVSNTASAMMMLPIAASLVAISERVTHTTTPQPATSPSANSPLAYCLYLGIAYAATFGGLGTPIGTPPNAFAVAFLEKQHNHTIGFREWMIAAAPLVLSLLFITWFLLTRVLHPLRAVPRLPGRDFATPRLKALGPLSGAEWTTLAVFLFAVVGWIAREPISRALGLVDLRPDGSSISRLTDAGVAITAALLLFVLPTAGRRAGRTVLHAPDFERVPWGVLILFGGGLSLAAAMDASGLTNAIGSAFAGLRGVHPFVLLLLVAAVVTALSELASNTAVAATLIPVLASAAPAIGVDPVLLIFPATLACSFGFMLPVATPPNAIVYATGRITASRMMRAGFIIDVVAIALVAVIYGLTGGILLSR